MIASCTCPAVLAAFLATCCGSTTRRHHAYEQQLDMEARLQAEAGRTLDHAEGVKAFLEKRDARFAGR